MVVRNTTALSAVRHLATSLKKAEYKPIGPYAGKGGARRLAREMGFMMNDFPARQHERAIRATYEELMEPLYGRRYLPRGEWVREVKTRIGRTK